MMPENGFSFSSTVTTSFAQHDQEPNIIPTHPNPYPNTSIPSNKRKRNLPGTPDPDAEVVALSPNSLQAKNRFMCEICNKGFQREQNLQLHRRGHNLPWKLKQRAGKEDEVVVKKKVYICPVKTCVHNDPTRALGDLTGIKKHYCRKHGEKKWKCDKCSKKYAVQSDWKAHSKICGTKQYRCDCGILFSRKDSFITHRAFCDALAGDSSRRFNESISNNLQNSQYPQMFCPEFHGSGHHDHNHQLVGSSSIDPVNDNSFPMSSHFSSGSSTKPRTWINNNNYGSYIEQEERKVDLSQSVPVLYSSKIHQHKQQHHHHMSATELLQKAAQIGSTMSINNYNNGKANNFGLVVTSTTTSASKGLSNIEASLTREFLGVGDVQHNIAYDTRISSSRIPLMYFQQQQLVNFGSTMEFNQYNNNTS